MATAVGFSGNGAGVTASESIKQGKVNSVTGRGGAQSSETSRLSHFLDMRLTDGGKDVSRTHRSTFTREDNGHSCLLEATSIPGLGATKRIRSTEKCNDLTGNRIRDLPVCSGL
jgi:hypothetical protein